MKTFQARLGALLFMGVLLALAACGDRPQGLQSNTTQGFTPNSTVFPAGNYFDNSTSGGQGVDDSAELFGDMASDGTGTYSDPGDFDGADFGLLQDALGGLSLNQRVALKNNLQRKVNSCDFLGSSTSFEETNCKNGSSSSCGKHLLGFGRRLFQKMLRQLSSSKLGKSAQLGAMLKAESQMCSAIDPNDHSAFKSAVEKKKAACMRGDIRSCLGLLLLLIKSFLGAILGALFGGL